jgi:hypothetical protein
MTLARGPIQDDPDPIHARRVDLEPEPSTHWDERGLPVHTEPIDRFAAGSRVP